MSILLLEDQPLIAMDTEAMLRRTGFAQFTHFAAVAPALSWLSQSRPDLAILEIALQDESCLILAQHFLRENVPFIIYTGASRALVDDHTLFVGAEWVSKPSEPDFLDAIISRVLGLGAGDGAAGQG